jgi:hypothetical protein
LKRKAVLSWTSLDEFGTAGVAIHIPEDGEQGSCMPPDGLIVRQQGGVPESTAFEFEGGTGLF